MSTVDLHFHSAHSDGKLSVVELATLIKKSGLKYCSLTDHDTVSGVLELEECLRGSGITVIPGVELTTLHQENEIHILAYDFDIETVGDVLQERNDLVQKQKMKEMKNAIDLFRQQGLKVSDGLTPSEKRPVGYTLAVDICKQQENQNIFVQRHGKTLVYEDIYFEYQMPGKSCAVKRSGVSIEWLLGKLKNKVADFIIAHPFVQVSVVAVPLTENGVFSLLDMGLSGVEVYHDKTADDKIQWLKKMVSEKKLHYTGGSDFHGHKNDMQLGFYGPTAEIPDFKISHYTL